MRTSVPVWLANDGGLKPPLSAGRIAVLYPQIDSVSSGEHPRPVFRGVPPARLLNVLSTGIDVDPTDARIYCSGFDKAWEYGGTSMGTGLRLIYALDGRKLDRTFRVLAFEASPTEIDVVRATYPYQHLEHPDSIWLSRVDRYSPGYEVPYGYWVPGNANDALMGVFLLGGEQCREVLETVR